MTSAEAFETSAVDDHCEFRKNLMFHEKDVEKNTELNNEWHSLIKQAHRDEVSDVVFGDADLAHYVGELLSLTTICAQLFNA